MSHPSPTPVDAFDLRGLIGFDASSRTFLSVYVRAPEGVSPFEGELGRLHMSVAEHAEESDALAEALEGLQAWFDDCSLPDSGTVCVFVCVPLDVFEVVHVPASLNTGVWLDASPYVRPITEYLDEITHDGADERAEEQALWAEASAALAHGEGAVAGISEVMRALKRSAVRVVLIARTFEAPGQRCRCCGSVFEAGHRICPSCGDDALFAVDLVDECVELASWSKAALQYLDERPELAAHGGIVALLT
ncbi:MAG: hypothetical protein ACE366_02360 [Bradymonadia bacterium]